MAHEIRLSATRVSTFLQCKQKYWFNYVEHLPKLDNPVFRLGIAVHGALEFAGKIWVNNQIEKFTKDDINKTLSEYDRISAIEGIEDMAVYSEGKDLVKQRLKDFKIGRKIISLEKKFGFENAKEFIDVRTKDDVPLMGAMDKIVEIDDETILIVDYKTSKTAPTTEQLKTDTQLSLYDLVASIMYPQYTRVIVSLDLLKHDIMYSYRTLKERKNFEEYLKVIYDQMIGLKKEDAKPQLNMFCGWCDYKEYCPGYKQAKDKTNGKFQSLVETSINDLVCEWERVKNEKKILEQRERDIALILTENIRQNRINIVTDDIEVYVRQNSRKSYDLETVFNIVPREDLIKLVSLNKSAVENYISVNPSVKDKIEHSATTNFTSPFLATKKSK